MVLYSSGVVNVKETVCKDSKVIIVPGAEPLVDAKKRKTIIWKAAKKEIKKKKKVEEKT